MMTDNVTVVRYNDRLKATDERSANCRSGSNGSRSTTRICGRPRPSRTPVSSGTCWSSHASSHSVHSTVTSHAVLITSPISRNATTTSG